MEPIRLQAHNSELQSAFPSGGASLDWDEETFRNALHAASEIVVRFHRNLEGARVSPQATPDEIIALLSEDLPSKFEPINEVFEEVERKIFVNSSFYQSPRFFGYINGCGNHAAIIGELLAAALNQLCAKWHFSPAASQVERQVVRWISQFIGYHPAPGGCLVSGGSAGNLIAIATARKQKAPFDVASMGMRSGPPLTVYISTEGHASTIKAMRMLGMGDHYLRRIPVNEDFTVNLSALRRQVVEDREQGLHPICVIGNAGTTNTGAIDPLRSLAEFCRSQDLWFHVDASYGGPAARTRAAGRLFDGLDKADSVVTNPHKWLYAPAEAACILVKDPRALQSTFRIDADYLRKEQEGSGEGQIDFKDFSPQLSRSFRALKIWITFKAYGELRLRAAIENNIETMRGLAQAIDESEDFVRLAPVPLSVVCFQYRTSDRAAQENPAFLDNLNERIIGELERDGRVFISGTKIQERTVLRACSVNHRLTREHVDYLLTVIREIGSKLAWLGLHSRSAHPATSSSRE